MQLSTVFWQLAQDVLQVVQMWVAISGYVPVGQDAPATQEKDAEIKKDSEAPDVLQAEQLVADPLQI